MHSQKKCWEKVKGNGNGNGNGSNKSRRHQKHYTIWLPSYLAAYLPQIGFTEIESLSLSAIMNRIVNVTIVALNVHVIEKAFTNVQWINAFSRYESLRSIISSTCNVIYRSCDGKAAQLWWKFKLFSCTKRCRTLPYTHYPLNMPNASLNFGFDYRTFFLLRNDSLEIAFFTCLESFHTIIQSVCTFCTCQRTSNINLVKGGAFYIYFFFHWLSIGMWKIAENPFENATS